MRNWLDKFAVGFAALVIRLRWIVILGALGAAVYLGSGAQHLAYSNNYRTFFSEENPELRTFEDFQATYTKSDNLYLVFKPTDGSEIFTRENLTAIAEFTEAAWRLPYATRVDSVTNFQYTYADGDELIVEDLVPDSSQMSAEFLRERKAAALAEPLLNGQIITDDGLVAAILVTLNYPEESLSEVPEAVAAARTLRAEFLKNHPQFEVYLTGASMLSNAFSEAIQSDFKTLIPLMILIVIATTIIAVRSVSATLITVLLVVLSSASAMGWAGHAGIELAGPSPSAVIVILTLAIADSMHVLISLRGAMRDGLEKKAAIIEAMKINFLAVTITSLTTIVGFMSLNFSDSPPFRDFGNISAVGIFAAWALSITFLPAALSLAPLRFSAVDKGERKSMLRGLADFVIAHNRKLFALTATASLVLVGFIPTIELSDEFRKYFDKRIEFRTDTDAAAEYFGFYSMEFSVKAGEPGGVSDPEFLRKLEAFGEWLRDNPSVVHVYSIADIMKRLNKNLNADDPAYYSLPEDKKLSAQYLLLFELSLPYGLDINDRINIDKSATRVTAQLDGDVDTKDIRKFLRDSENWFKENAPEISGPATGPQVMFTFIAQRNVESMVTGTVIAVILIALIMMAALRSISMGLLSMAPNGLPILAGFGVWALIVGQVGFSVAAVASLSLGIVIDDTVHFLVKYQRARRQIGMSVEDSIRYAFETVGAAIIFNTLILIAGFMVLTFSAFKINAELGLLTTLTISLALILDFLLLPGLLLLTSRNSGEPISQPRGEFDERSAVS